jgi:U3 small nucleolar RNA-associated protein 14
MRRSSVATPSEGANLQNPKYGNIHITCCKDLHTNHSQRQEESDNSEDDENDDEGETLGEDAIDLATALDQWEEDSEQDEKQKKKKPKAGDSDSSASEESDADDDEEEDSEEADDDDDDDDDDDGDEADPEKLSALRGLVSGFGGDEEDDGKAKGSAKQKISIGDLGLGNLQDPFMKSSLKLMNKESKEKRPGATKKLDVPLARRQQDRIDRSAAYDKTNETLDRWTDTVKHNRRADHLVFPLPETTGFAGLDNTEIQPLASSNAQNELESAVLSIMDQSGLSMEKAPKPKEKVYDEDGNELTKKEIANRKRLERELQSREAKRAARIKKIKSKAYHRVHRKQRERDDVATREAMAEAGEIDSDEEREAQDRRRALERVGLRHKESKWAKMGSRAKRAVWDDDFRAGLTDMARQDEELRRRKEGRRAGSDDDTSSSDDDSDDGDASLRRQLAQLEEDDDTEPQSGLMSMKFMQKAEAARKKENDELIQQIRRELDGDGGEADEDDEAEEVGRRQYGGAPGAVSTTALDTSKRKAKKTRDNDDDGDDVVITLDGSAPKSGKTRSGDLPASESTAKSTEGAWSRGETRRKKKGTMGARIDELDLNANVMVAARPQQKKSGKNAATAKPNNGEDDSGDDDDDDAAADQHLPLAIRDQELVARAFAGEDVVGEFEREKAEVEEADDDKVIDNTLPGWGSWVGDGVSNKEKKRHQGRFLTKVKGVNKKDRKDAKLDKVIINEKRVKKVRYPLSND